MRIALMKTWLGALACLLCGSLALAAPVAEEDRLPIDLRRTTLVVKDIEHSLAFYRDALGMQVIYDNMIINPRSAPPEKADKVMRLVFLRANDNYVGIVGLLQYLKPKKETIDLTDSAFKEGTAVLVFNLENLHESFAKARQVKGVVVLEEPKPVSYPSYDGKSMIHVLVSAMQDPDGFTVELNQLQQEIRQNLPANAPPASAAKSNN